MVDSDSQIKEVLHNFFKEHCSCHPQRTPFLAPSILPCLQDFDHRMLLQDVTSIKIYSCLKVMGLGKASGLDSFPSGFFQTYWLIVRAKLSKVVRELFSTTIMLES